MAFGQKDLKIKGWAIESRIYAEDPYRKFLPSIGRLVRYSPPAEGEHGDKRHAYTVRNDAGVREGDEISMFYDPMISKLCTWGATRIEAVDGMGRALEDFHIEGLGQNIPFLAAVMDQPRFREGRLATSYIADEFPDGFQGTEATSAQKDIMTAVAAFMHLTMAGRARRNGSDLAKPLSRKDWVVRIGDEQRPVSTNYSPGALDVTLAADGRELALRQIDWRPGQAVFRGVLDGKALLAGNASGGGGLRDPSPRRHRAGAGSDARLGGVA